MHILIKLQISEEKKKNHTKLPDRKVQVSYKEKKIRLTLGFSFSSLDMRKQTEESVGLKSLNAVTSQSEDILKTCNNLESILSMYYLRARF